MSLNIKDEVQKPTEGYFKLECLDKDGIIIDTYEHKNMIMQKSKATVANATMGNSPQYDYINKIVLGDKGSDGGNLLVGRDFSFTREKLFAQTEGGDTFGLLFDPLARSSDGQAPLKREFKTGEVEIGSASKITVNIINASTIQYIFDLAPGSANGGGTDGVKPWTEAALYVRRDDNVNYNDNTIPDTAQEYGNIFAMRTFPAKIKDATTTFRITWEIVF